MSVAPKASTPSWPTPPEDGWTADDLDRLPNLPPHTEWIDGSLVFVSPQQLHRHRHLRERMKLDVPFPLDLDLTQIKARRGRNR